MEKGTVAVAMSGGADSTYAAYKLKKDGYKVIGLMAKFWVVPTAEGNCRSNLCCSPESLEAARLNAKKLGIEFYLVDLSKEFKQKVVDYFIDEYDNGRTPNPCVVCNREIKFGLLFEKAKELGAKYFATGHYVDTSKKDGRLFLSKASDKTKDQSYFLWELDQKILPQLVFPLAKKNKKQILKEIKRLGLLVSPKESQDVCFIGDLSQRAFLKKYIKAQPGNFVDKEGNKLGEHKGIYGFTIGQRHNLGLNLPEPKYVISLDHKANTVTLGDVADLESREFEIKDSNFFVDNIEKIKNIKVQTRYGQVGVKCVIKDNKIVLAESLKSITPGQSAVFYQDKILIGGGIIK